MGDELVESEALNQLQVEAAALAAVLAERVDLDADDAADGEMEVLAAQAGLDAETLIRFGAEVAVASRSSGRSHAAIVGFVLGVRWARTSRQ